MCKASYATAGEILLEEFLKPYSITPYRLAKDIGVSQARIAEIIAAKRAITVDTGLRLSKYFGLNDAFWTGLQMDYETATQKERMAEILTKIKPLDQRAA
ncbi:HigA family addiction module antitoxin [Methylophilus glucosoxydans]|uniref:HigA family addiction module antitoxin n=1 Tax=Methylophilus glucosoxydans TaxID=752553 RepID=A0ABW3GQA2_9PROT